MQSEVNSPAGQEEDKRQPTGDLSLSSVHFLLSQRAAKISLHFAVWTLPCVGKKWALSSHSSRGSHQRTGSWWSTATETAQGTNTVEVQRKKISDKWMEIVPETLKEWSFGNQLPHLWNGVILLPLLPFREVKKCKIINDCNVFEHLGRNIIYISIWYHDYPHNKKKKNIKITIICTFSTPAVVHEIYNSFYCFLSNPLHLH